MKAVPRGTDLGCESIQIFNQSPRAWKPTAYTDEDFAAFNEAMDDSPVDAVIIHAVYLINCATPDPELRQKSLASLTHALRIGDAIGATGVVLHPGARKQDELVPAIQRAGEVIGEAVADSESCPVLIEQMAGHKGILGHTFGEIAGPGRSGRWLGPGRALPRLLPPLRVRLRHPDDRRDRRRARRGRPGGRNGPAEGAPRKRLEGGVRRQAGPARRPRQGRDRRGIDGPLPLRTPVRRASSATLETPGADKKGATAEDVSFARELRERGRKRRGLPPEN